MIGMISAEVTGTIGGLTCTKINMCVTDIELHLDNLIVNIHVCQGVIYHSANYIL